ncbi:MAG: cysteine rich repeat-containing protein [Hyphomicrobium sp.]
MRKSASVIGVLTFALLTSVAPIGGAIAETDIVKKRFDEAEAAVEKLLVDCEKELKEYCSTVTPGEGRVALCMMAHENKMSDKCYSSLWDAAESVDLAVSNIMIAAKACEADVEKLCGDVEAGQGRIAQCLIGKKSDLSTSCGAEVAGFEARMQK